MKNLVWNLFEKTGKIAYYELYKELRDGRDDESGGAEIHRLQGKR